MPSADPVHALQSTAQQLRAKAAMRQQQCGGAREHCWACMARWLVSRMVKIQLMCRWTLHALAQACTLRSQCIYMLCVCPLPCLLADMTWLPVPLGLCLQPGTLRAGRLAVQATGTAVVAYKA